MKQELELFPTTASPPGLVTSYLDALTRIESSYQQDQAEDVRDICLPTLMTHGAPTPWALVFLHGFTNCPEQFCQLGRRFFDLGHNIYVPRQPFHGLPPLSNHLAL
jgi:carboxylesterase